MVGSATAGPIAEAPEPGDFVFARGKSWIVERAEKAGSVPTLHLVSCEDDSQGETISLRSRPNCKPKSSTRMTGRPF